MKSWRRLCFLVLAVPLISGGQPLTTDPTHNEESAGPPPPRTPPPLSESLNDTESNSTHTTLTPPLTPPYSSSHELENATDVTSAVNMTRTGSTPAPTAASTGETERTAVGKATVPMTTSNSQNQGTKEKGDNLPWGYVIMALICIMIIALCVLLFFLRRASRIYSFDLQFPDPINDYFNGPTGTFEPVYLDDLAPNYQEATSEPPVTNGTSPQSDEKGSNGENAPQEQTHANGLETSSLSCSTSPTAGDDPADMTSDPASSANLFFDDTGEMQQNENNNNPSVCSSEPFVEINLDEPEWCDQLLTSSEATSSVLPFSPFSFSTSS